MSGPETPELAEAAVEGGADLVELGFPFSDPLADGPVVRRAAEKALAQGMRTKACLECLAAVRERVDVPLVPDDLLVAAGGVRLGAVRRRRARRPARPSLIVADLPVGDQPGLRRVQLVAPTSTDERLGSRPSNGRLALPRHGDRNDRSPPGLSSSLAPLAERARAAGTGVPLYAGFGISTPGRRPGRGRVDRRRRRRLAAPRGGRGWASSAARLRPLPAGRARPPERRGRRYWPRIGDARRPPGTTATRFRGFAGVEHWSKLTMSTLCRSAHARHAQGEHHGEHRATGSVEARPDRAVLSRLRDRRDRAGRGPRRRLVVRESQADRRLDASAGVEDLRRPTADWTSGKTSRPPTGRRAR